MSYVKFKVKTGSGGVVVGPMKVEKKVNFVFSAFGESSCCLYLCMKPIILGSENVSAMSVTLR